MPENKELLGQEEKQEQIRQESSKKEFLTDIDQKEVTIPREARTWIEKIEIDPQQQQDDQQSTNGDDSLLKPIHSVNQIVLPTTKDTFSTGFNKKISNAGRWLSEFILRIIKKENGNVKFKEE